MKKIITVSFISFLLLFIIKNTAWAQAPTVEWSDVLTGGFKNPYQMATSNSQSIYITTADSVVKYNASGHAAWRFSESDAYPFIAKDNAGNLFIRGLYSLEKVDTNGHLIWQKAFSINAFVVAGCQADNAGNFYFVVDSADNSIHTYKVDNAGNVAWEKTLKSSHEQFGVSAVTDNAGNVYVCYDVDNTNDSTYLVKYDNAGNTQWVKNLNGGFAYSGASSAVAFTSGILVDEHGSLNKVGFDGNIQWSTPYPSSGYKLDEDFNIFFASNDSMGLIDSTGSLLWKKPLPDSLQQYHHIAAGGHHYYVGITYTTTTAYFSHYFIASYDEQGNPLWTWHAGDGITNADTLNEIQADKYGNVYATGEAWYQYMWTVKLNDNGAVVTAVNQPVKAPVSVAVYPNPAGNYLLVNTGADNKAKTLLTITDVAGRQLMETETSNTVQQLDISILTNGIYFLTVKSNDNIQTIRFIRQE